MKDFWKTLQEFNPRQVDQNNLKYLERFLIFLFDVLSSLKIRQYVSDYLQDNFFLLKSKISVLAKSRKGKLFREILG